MKTMIGMMKTMAVTLTALALSTGVLACKVNLDQSDGKTTADASGSTGSESKDPNSVPDKGVTAVTGHVLEDVTLKPIQGAIITTEPPTASILTNSKGEYVLDGGQFSKLTKGLNIRISASKTGYVLNSANVTLTSDKVTGADILLQVAAADFNIVPGTTTMQYDEGLFDTSDVAEKSLSVKMETSATKSSASVSIIIPAEYKWLTVDPSTFSISGAPKNVTVRCNRKGKKAGTYNGSFTITANDATASVDVAVIMTLTEDHSGGTTTGGPDAGSTTGTDAGGTGTGDAAAAGDTTK